MTDPETAICCMIVSNPVGGERPHAWQKRVNDHMRTLASQLAEARRDCQFLLATLDYQRECTGEGPDGADAAVVAQIRAKWRKETPK